MKKVILVLVPLLALGAAARGENGGPSSQQNPPTTGVEVVNDIGVSQTQDTTVTSTGGYSDSKSSSSSQVNIDTTSISNYENRTAPLTSLPPYLPYWNHGGWGTVKAYFANGPSANDAIYETTFDPKEREDMRELRSVLGALPHAGLLEAVGGVLNAVAVVVLGTPDMYHHGRGFEIANSIVRDVRPEGKPLLVFIDSNVDTRLLREEGYAYVGKVSIEGDVDRNWDQAYKAAVTEALLWDVDILLVSGGMKGVTVGENTTFPSAAAGYGQANYSLSLFGAAAKGITEGKGKAVLGVEAYRYNPERLARRRIPASLYERIRVRPIPVSAVQNGQPMPAVPGGVSAAPGGVPAAPTALRPSKEAPGIEVRRELLEMAGLDDAKVGCVTVR